MAGMLPGVECARRRRFHLSSDNSPGGGVSGGSTRRTSFCLYTSSHEISHSSVSSLRIVKKENNENSKLGATARQAKERLDERLRTQQRKSSAASKGENTRVSGGDGKNRTKGEIQTGSRKKFSWAKLNWKASEQEECSICLERFKTDDTLVHLPCAHKFHCKCLIPWLQNNAHCPCCRMEFFVQFA
ncbi:probable E3 ubiquitin-protein ligase RHY1A [Euphorbia lathyris]|uniref:probable E3 ubiquitin-protein ligase RHY1A n=1 Tax=Euphorbia lathyris TaxID=212925 RepID=UPI003313A0D5